MRLAAALLASLLLSAPPLVAQSAFKLQTRPATPGAEVLLDGQAAGTTGDNGALFVTTTPGNHRVQVLAGGTPIADRTLSFDADLNFVRVDVQVRTYKVVLETNVAGATVSVDGRAMATTAGDGRALLELPGGATYQLRVSKSGYADVASRLEVQDLDRRFQVRLVATGAEAPTAANPAATLHRGAQAFFTGDYAGTLTLLQGPPLADARLQAQVELFRAAAAHALYVLGGEQDAAGRAAAAEAVRRCRALAPRLTPDRSAFSPRFVAFFAQPG